MSTSLTSTNSYRSPAAAQRAANRVSREIEHARCEVVGSGLIVYAYEATLTPGQREWLATQKIEITAPPAPSPAEPLFKKRRPQTVTNPSKVENAVAVAREIFERYHAEDRLDARTEAVEEAIFAGVNPNTAKTIYARFREEKGLPGIRASRRAKARKTALALSAKHTRPTGQKAQNGIAHPTPGTIMGDVWAGADLMTRKLGRPVKRGELARQLPGVNEHSLAIYHKKWAKYHGHRPGQHHGKKDLSS